MKPTICVECGHEEQQGRSLVYHLCMALPERTNYVTGERYKPKPCCQGRNPGGKCLNWIPKEARKEE